MYLVHIKDLRIDTGTPGMVPYYAIPYYTGPVPDSVKLRKNPSLPHGYISDLN